VAPESRLLSDGSRIELNNGAEVAVDFGGALRRVELRRGDALFHVAKNPNRAFVVTAGRVEIRAVGTAFSVQLGEAQVKVLVTEGRVAVEDARARGGPTYVDAGNCAVVEVAPAVAKSPDVLPVSQAEVSDRLSWAVPRLQFSGTALSEALPLFNRYGNVRLVLADPALGSLKLSGVLRADNTGSLLSLLEGEFGLRATRRGDEIILTLP